MNKMQRMLLIVGFFVLALQPVDISSSNSREVLAPSFYVREKAVAQLPPCDASLNLKEEEYRQILNVCKQRLSPGALSRTALAHSGLVEALGALRTKALSESITLKEGRSIGCLGVKISDLQLSFCIGAFASLSKRGQPEVTIIVYRCGKAVPREIMNLISSVFLENKGWGAKSKVFAGVVVGSLAAYSLGFFGSPVERLGDAWCADKRVLRRGGDTYEESVQALVRGVLNRCRVGDNPYDRTGDLGCFWRRGSLCPNRDIRGADFVLYEAYPHSQHGECCLSALSPCWRCEAVTFWERNRSGGALDCRRKTYPWPTSDTGGEHFYNHIMSNDDGPGAVEAHQDGTFQTNLKFGARFILVVGMDVIVSRWRSVCELINRRSEFARRGSRCSTRVQLGELTFGAHGLFDNVQGDLGELFPRYRPSGIVRDPLACISQAHPTCLLVIDDLLGEEFSSRYAGFSCTKEELIHDSFKRDWDPEHVYDAFMHVTDVPVVVYNPISGLIVRFGPNQEYFTETLTNARGLFGVVADALQE